MAIPLDAIQADMAVLDEMVRRIVSRFQPQRIILFGSRARGDATKDSDYDLLIVSPSNEPRSRRATPVYEALWNMPVAKDVVWWTEEEIARWREVKNHFITHAIREGKVVYEAVT